MDFTQDFFTSRNNVADGNTRIGRKDRLWYDSITNTIRISDGVTPGGIVVNGGGGGGSYTLPTASTTVKGGVKIDGATITINDQVISVQNGVFTTGSYANPAWITSLAYSKITGAPTLTGGSANQILVKRSTTDLDFQWEDLIVDPAYTKLIDDTVANTMYLGEAQPNSLESAAAWRIQKIIFDAAGNVDSVRFAAGGLFNQIWNNRTSLSYV